MMPFNYLDDAEEWMNKNASGSVCVLIKVIRSKASKIPPPPGSIPNITTRWILEWSKDEHTNK